MCGQSFDSAAWAHWAHLLTNLKGCGPGCRVKAAKAEGVGMPSSGGILPSFRLLFFSCPLPVTFVLFML